MNTSLNAHFGKCVRVVIGSPRHRGRRVIALLAIPFLLVPLDASFAQQRDTPVIVVDTFDERNRVVVVAASSFNEALRDMATDDNRPPLISPVEALIELCRNPPPKAPPLLIRLQECMDCLAAFSERRYITARQDHVVMFVLYDGTEAERGERRPTFSEAARESELVATAKALRPFALEAAGELRCDSYIYTLQRQRSRFLASVQVPAAGASISVSDSSDLIRPATGPAAAENTVEVRTPELILGPQERWFFSADFSVAKAAVGIGKDPTPDAEALETKDFFVALNLALGDLLTDRDSPLQRRSFWRELVIKTQVTPSKEPWESWAVGLGIRGYRLKTIFWNWDVIHPYATVGRQRTDDGGRWRAVFGLGFDPRSLTRPQ